MEKLGIKKSVALMLCSAIAFLLFLGFAVSFWFSFKDPKTVDDLSESEREVIENRASFVDVVLLAMQFEDNASTYGDFNEVISITCVSCFCSDTTMLAKVTFSSKNCIYVNLANNFKIISESAYDNYIKNRKSGSTAHAHPSRVDEYIGVEVKYVDWYASNEDSIDKIYDIIRGRIGNETSYHAAKNAVRDYAINRYDQITEVRCINMGKGMVYVKIVLSNGETMCGIATRTSAMPMDLDSNAYNAYIGMDETIYSNINLKVLINDSAGY